MGHMMIDGLWCAGRDHTAWCDAVRSVALQDMWCVAWWWHGVPGGPEIDAQRVHGGCGVRCPTVAWWDVCVALTWQYGRAMDDVTPGVYPSPGLTAGGPPRTVLENAYEFPSKVCSTRIYRPSSP